MGHPNWEFNGLRPLNPKYPLSDLSLRNATSRRINKDVPLLSCNRILMTDLSEFFHTRSILCDTARIEPSVTPRRDEPARLRN